MNKIDLTDVTFLIPIRVDSQERIDNLKSIIGFIARSFKTNLVVLESDKNEKCQLSNDVTKIFKEDNDVIFHRTKYLNQMTEMASSPYLAIWDADVIGVPAQIEEGIELLRQGDADMVYPYDKYFYSVPESLRRIFIDSGCNIEYLFGQCKVMPLMHGYWSVGGGFLVNKKAYIDAGMENEHFYGWGPEDAERYVRWDTLGYRIRRINGPLFHLSHPRGKTSVFASRNIEFNNRMEYLKVCSMYPQELKDYINSNYWNFTNQQKH